MQATEPHDEANSVVLTKHVVASFLDAVFPVWYFFFCQWLFFLWLVKASCDLFHLLYHIIFGIEMIHEFRFI